MRHERTILRGNRYNSQRDACERKGTRPQLSKSIPRLRAESLACRLVLQHPFPSCVNVVRGKVETYRLLSPMFSMRWQRFASRRRSAADDDKTQTRSRKDHGLTTDTQSTGLSGASFWLRILVLEVPPGSPINSETPKRHSTARVYGALSSSCGQSIIYRLPRRAINKISAAPRMPTANHCEHPIHLSTSVNPQT